MNPNLTDARKEVATMGKVSDKTKAHYQAMVRRLMDGRAAPRSKRTARLYRAAWVWYQRSSLARLLAVWDVEQTDETVNRIATHLAALRGIRAADLASGSGASSKKKGMEALPPAWPSTLIESAQETELRAVLSVLALTGIRPSELEKGLRIERKDNSLAITVTGAKFDSDRGHETRTITLPIEGTLVDSITNYLNDLGTESATVSADPSRLRRALSKLGQQAFPGLGYRMTPYTLRHGVASACKSQKLDPTEIAKILGHRSTKSQSYYGRASLGQGGAYAEVRATTSGEIKDNARDPRCLHVVFRDTEVTSK